MSDDRREEELDAAAPSTPVMKPTKLGPANPALMDILPPDAGTSYSDDEEEDECEGEECDKKSKAFVHVIAELVKRGEEDLADELIALGKVRVPVLNPVQNLVHKWDAAVDKAIRAIIHLDEADQAETAGVLYNMLKLQVNDMQQQMAGIKKQYKL